MMKDTFWICADCEFKTPGGKDSPEATKHHEATGHEMAWMFGQFADTVSMPAVKDE